MEVHEAFSFEERRCACYEDPERAEEHWKPLAADATAPPQSTLTADELSGALLRGSGALLRLGLFDLREIPSEQLELQQAQRVANAADAGGSTTAWWRREHGLSLGSPLAFQPRTGHVAPPAPPPPAAANRWDELARHRQRGAQAAAPPGTEEGDAGFRTGFGPYTDSSSVAAFRGFGSSASSAFGGASGFGTPNFNSGWRTSGVPFGGGAAPAPETQRTNDAPAPNSPVAATAAAPAPAPFGSGTGFGFGAASNAFAPVGTGTFRFASTFNPPANTITNNPSTGGQPVAAATFGAFGGGAPAAAAAAPAPGTMFPPLPQAEPRPQTAEERRAEVLERARERRNDRNAQNMRDR